MKKTKKQTSRRRKTWLARPKRTKTNGESSNSRFSRPKTWDDVAAGRTIDTDFSDDFLLRYATAVLAARQIFREVVSLAPSIVRYCLFLLTSRGYTPQQLVAACGMNELSLLRIAVGDKAPSRTLALRLLTLLLGDRIGSLCCHLVFSESESASQAQAEILPQPDRQPPLMQPDGSIDPDSQQVVDDAVELSDDMSGAIITNAEQAFTANQECARDKALNALEEILSRIKGESLT